MTMLKIALRLNKLTHYQTEVHSGYGVPGHMVNDHMSQWNFVHIHKYFTKIMCVKVRALTKFIASSITPFPVYIAELQKKKESWSIS